MNVRTMRSIDRFAGIPLCRAASALMRFGPRRRASENPSAWENVLIIKFFGLGSILLSTPFLEALRTLSPRARITYLTFATNRELVERLRGVDEILTIDPSSFLLFIRDTISAFRRLRRRSPDAVFDLEFFSKFSTLLATVSGSPIRIGYALPARWRSTCVTHAVALDRSSHVTRTFMSLLCPFGLREDCLPQVARLAATTAETMSMQRKLRIGDNGIEAWSVNINAGRTSLERRWDPDRFMEVVKKLSASNPERRFFFLGTADEFVYVASALERHPDLNGVVFNCAGLLTLGETIALLRRSALLLSNDSGPVHVAAACGTPVVGLYGPESPELYGPLGTGRLIYRHLACSPCLTVYNAKGYVCPFNARCMKEITVDEVLAVIHGLIPADSISVAAQ